MSHKQINMKLDVVLIIIVAIIFGIGLDGYHCKMVQFIFGDSLSDVGNNKYLSKSLAQASLPWYGIDLGNGLPNGRFCNGRTVADIIGNSFTNPSYAFYFCPKILILLNNKIKLMMCFFFLKKSKLYIK